MFWWNIISNPNIIIVYWSLMTNRDQGIKRWCHTTFKGSTKHTSNNEKVWAIHNLYKVGYVFPRVIVFILPHAKFGPNDRKEDALCFSLAIWFWSTLPLSSAATDVSLSFSWDSLENKSIWQARVVVAASQVWSHTMIEFKGI